MLTHSHIRVACEYLKGLGPKQSIQTQKKTYLLVVWWQRSTYLGIGIGAARRSLPGRQHSPGLSVWKTSAYFRRPQVIPRDNRKSTKYGCRPFPCRFHLVLEATSARRLGWFSSSYMRLMSFIVFFWLAAGRLAWLGSCPASGQCTPLASLVFVWPACAAGAPCPRKHKLFYCFFGVDTHFESTGNGSGSKLSLSLGKMTSFSQAALSVHYRWV